MRDELQRIRENARKMLSEAKSLQELDAIRLKILGKKGELTTILRGMGLLTQDERPKIGQLANEIRAEIESNIFAIEKRLTALLQEVKMREEVIDVTLPGKRRYPGHRHPISIITSHVCEVFMGMGYSIAEGPEIEFDKYNFELLNIPKGHPARDAQDTFYINEDVVLRTHTSPVQARVMLSQKPPIKVVCPGRVFRSDAVDATHSPVFHQIEGLVVDKGITMGDLIGALNTFASRTFGPKTRIRLRPHHFQFTEPSAEVDVSCWECGGSGCRLCKNEGYIEILGAGMVNPKVLDMCGIDSEVYSGFAFGMGIERVTSCKFGIDDMRLLYENDIRFLNQF
ncbi:MAG: phenylalanine--tRNA ligase subunit alpha [Oscillospiraceae bacterium]|nr:phenylalanine--tRNA ligase subunit alpha [Oscillospiraceae bacterium]